MIDIRDSKILFSGIVRLDCPIRDANGPLIYMDDVLMFVYSLMDPRIHITKKVGENGKVKSYEFQIMEEKK